MIVEPADNPFDDAITLTDEQLDALAQFNGLFAEVVKNPDIDGNGIVDILEDKIYFNALSYGVVGGRYEGFLTPTIDTQLELYQFHFFTNIETCPQNVMLTGPVGSPFETPTSIERVQIGSYCMHRVVELPESGEFVPPQQGCYIINYPDSQLRFTVPDQSLALDHMITIVLTISLNDDLTIQTISWAYRLADGLGESFDPESLITQIQITLWDQAFQRKGCIVRI